MYVITLQRDVNLNKYSNFLRLSYGPLVHPLIQDHNVSNAGFFSWISHFEMA